MKRRAFLLGTAAVILAQATPTQPTLPTPPTQPTLPTPPTQPTLPTPPTQPIPAVPQLDWNELFRAGGVVIAFNEEEEFTLTYVDIYERHVHARPSPLVESRLWREDWPALKAIPPEA